MKHIILLEQALEALHTGDDQRQTIDDIRTYLAYITTHSRNCWMMGPNHYGCAVEHIRKLEKQLSELND